MADDRLLLVLDLDETLVFADAHLTQPDFTIGPWGVRKRPHLADFLARARDAFRLAVWTSAGADYAAGVVHHLFGAPHGLELLWSSDRCTPRFDYETGALQSLKTFRKLKRRGFDLRRVLVVDDTPEKHQRNWGNLVRVTPFLGDPADAELPKLANYLHTLRDVADVRAIDKRGWRRNF